MERNREREEEQTVKKEDIRREEDFKRIERKKKR